MARPGERAAVLESHCVWELKLGGFRSFLREGLFFFFVAMMGGDGLFGGHVLGRVTYLASMW